MSVLAESSVSARIQEPPRLYRRCEAFIGALVLFIIVFAPWAFGCTVSWAIWTVTALGYVMGAAAALKWFVARRSGFRMPGWEVNPDEVNPWPDRILAGLTAALLAYAFVSGLNARAIVDLTQGMPRLEYREAIAWLPQSFDGPHTLRAAIRYVALALIFWVTRDWLRGKSYRESTQLADPLRPPASAARLPNRWRRMLWTLALSSAALAVIGILQRVDGSRKLLWLVPAKPSLLSGYEYNPLESFGPFNYRGNAAAYFNLVWPLCLGFWWLGRRESRLRQGINFRTGSDPHMILLLLAGLLMICPLLTTSRGGSLILAAQFAACLVIMTASGGRRERFASLGATLTFVLATFLGIFLAGPELTERSKNWFADAPANRTRIYEVGHQMAAEFGHFGSGPETFTALYGLYRVQPEEVWEGFAHNDYLETRITFGTVGSILILLALLCIPWLAWRGPNLAVWWPFPAFIAVALTGMLVHASFDFPFQIFSLHLLFLIGCAMASSLRTRGAELL